MKFRLLLLVVAVGLVVAAMVTGAFSSLREITAPAAAEPVVGSSAGMAVPAGNGAREAREVLSHWDVRRSAAWATGSVEDLRALYAVDSVAGAKDVSMLEAWLAKGMQVEGLKMQVLSFSVVRQTSEVLVLEVTDRIAGGVAVGRGQRLELPADHADARTITMVRVEGMWLVDSVKQSA